jgi:hypothetical protein
MENGTAEGVANMQYAFQNNYALDFKLWWPNTE